MGIQDTKKMPRNAAIFALLGSLCGARGAQVGVETEGEGEDERKTHERGKTDRKRTLRTGRVPERTRWDVLPNQRRRTSEWSSAIGKSVRKGRDPRGETPTDTVLDDQDEGCGRRRGSDLWNGSIPTRRASGLCSEHCCGSKGAFFFEMVSATKPFDCLWLTRLRNGSKSAGGRHREHQSFHPTENVDQLVHAERRRGTGSH